MSDSGNRKPARRFKARSALILIVSALLAEQAQAAEAKYCVVDVPVMRRSVAGLAGPFDGPERYLYDGVLPTPFAYSEVRMPAKNGGYWTQKLYWRFTSDRRLEGPYQYREMLHEIGNIGDIAYFSGSQAPWFRGTSKGDVAAPQKFFAATSGGLPQLLPAPPDRADWHSSGTSLAANEGGIKVHYWRDVPGKQQEQEYYIIRTDGYSRTVRDEGGPVFRPLAGSNLKVSTDGHLSFSDAVGGNALKLKLRLSGEYGSGWESVNIDRYDWIFAEGGGNDYAIKLDTSGGKIALEKLYRYTGHGWLARFFQWLSSDDFTPENRTFWGSQSVSFSPLLRLTIFGRPSQVLKDGLLEDIGDGEVDRYQGDASGAGAALFSGSKRELFAFDGEQLQLLVGPGERRVNTHEHMPKSIRDKMQDEVYWLGRWSVKDVPEIGRTFVFIDGKPFELKGRVPKVRLEPLPPVSYLGETVNYGRYMSRHFTASKFVRFPGSEDVLAFGTRGVFQYAATNTLPVWQMNPAVPFKTNLEAIDFSSIVSVGAWNGIMFQSRDKRFHFVRRCER